MGVATDASGTFVYWFGGKPLTTIGNSQGGKMFFWREGLPFDMYVPIVSASAVGACVFGFTAAGAGKDDGARGVGAGPGFTAQGAGAVQVPQYLASGDAQAGA